MTETMVVHGIVLRETETKETDKILTLLTNELGKIPVIARGARRKNSRYSAVAQPLAYGEWTLSQRKEWFYASEGSSRIYSTPIRLDPICVASRIRWLSPPERVPAARLRVR